jgi:hypothetical protein
MYYILANMQLKYVRVVGLGNILFCDYANLPRDGVTSCHTRSLNNPPQTSASNFQQRPANWAICFRATFPTRLLPAFPAGPAAAYFRIWSSQGQIKRDGISPYVCGRVAKWLYRRYGNNGIVQWGPRVWPCRSWDLTPFILCFTHEDSSVLDIMAQGRNQMFMTQLPIYFS